MGDRSAHQVVDLVRGAWVTLSLRAACRLDLFDALDEPRTADDLGSRVGADPRTLTRLLRVLAHLDLVADDGECWAVTDLGVTLRGGHPSGMRDLVLMQTWLPSLAAWHHLEDAVRTGQGAYERVNGRTWWAELAALPDLEHSFNGSMARRAADQAQALVAHAGLDDGGSLVDVGGGRGGMVEALLRERPRLTAVVADRPDVAAQATAYLAAAGFGTHAHGEPCDFFTSVPGGGDVYTISNVLHDWDDDDCVKILTTVRAAMRADARLLVVEKVLGVRDRSPQAARDLALVDLHMLVMFGARERTQDEYDALVTAAGFTPTRLLAAECDWNVLEARPAG
jgi:orsellinic acid C2-O-methyltransferase